MNHVATIRSGFVSDQCFEDGQAASARAAYGGVDDLHIDAGLLPGEQLSEHALGSWGLIPSWAVEQEIPNRRYAEATQRGSCLCANPLERRHRALELGLRDRPDTELSLRLLSAE